MGIKVDGLGRVEALRSWVVGGLLGLNEIQLQVGRIQPHYRLVVGAGIGEELVGCAVEEEAGHGGLDAETATYGIKVLKHF